MRQHAQKRVGDINDRKDDRRDDRRNDDEHKHKACAAARVVFVLTAHVFDRQLLPRLIAKDGLVLRAVILERATDILHVRYRPHENQEDHNAHAALEHVARKHAPAFGHEAAEKTRQQQEQRDRQRNADHGRQAEDELIQPFRAELVFQPSFKLGWRHICLLVLKERGRIVDRLDAVLHRHEQAVSTAQDGQLPERGRLVRVLLLGHQLAVCLAHDRAGLFRAFHHDALDDGLPADRGFLLGCHVLSPSGV